MELKHAFDESPRPSRWQRTGAPTWAVAALAYGGWIALTLGYQAVPWWAMVPLAGSVMALCGSLQHETIHGHPTRWRWVNEALGWAPLWLWLFSDSRPY